MTQAPVVSARNLDLTFPTKDGPVHALKGERPALASQIAQGLLIADPHSAYAHYVLATAHADMGHGTDGRKSAARAYRYADNRVQKFQAAELAARLTFAEGHPTLTQLWLRRAVQNAPTPEIEEQLARDYARVRRENPFRFSITGGVKPSSNVNNGADTAQQVIDGLPFTGRLSGSAQALSGIWVPSTRSSGTVCGALKRRGRIFRVACLYNVWCLIAGRMIWHLKHVTVISERPMQMFHFGSPSRSARRAEAPM